MAHPIVSQLMQSEDPVIGWMALNRLVDTPIRLVEYNQARQAMVESPRVRILLAILDAPDGLPNHPYFKWSGGHWILAMLAETGYPPGDQRLIPLRDQQLDWLFSKNHAKNIRMINGRVRRCASQEGNALWSQLELGLADERSDQLAERLMEWQWDDGGWNCDRNPDARISSFMESLIPMRALALYAKKTGSLDARKAVERAAEIFLSRRMFRRKKDGTVMDQSFLSLHFPCYWHYDILFGLKVMAEAYLIQDPRCQEALEILESYMSPSGGFRTESRYYRTTRPQLSGYSPVDWGPTSKRLINPFVTIDAHWVLRRAKRLVNFQPI